MSKQAYALVSCLIFLLVAVAHVVLLVWQWDVIVEGWHVPAWASVVAIVVAGYLSFEGFRTYRQTRWFSLFR
jgi:hypothetical protein